VACLLFYTALPQAAFPPAEVGDLASRIGEGGSSVQASEDQEQDTDRWCSHPTWGQQFWQILALISCGTRLLELGHALHPTPMRTTECASTQMGEPADLNQREQGFLKLRDRLISLALFISLRNPWAICARQI